jgi:hypothetical protein
MPALPAQTPTVDGVATPLTRTNLTEYSYGSSPKSGDVEWVYFQSGSARLLPGCCVGGADDVFELRSSIGAWLAQGYWPSAVWWPW